ncbi:uncharacterized protein LOC118430840 [Branchiostoma floridae]|uniref:Uncharacterized protein LOC118430840 n=1 Tax=Branchiostoma floridae TaxID=7739 RepID=A0A9J7MB22_BRAFL|nr:uncharacterized protein LOC118430840 [Branchiostoma floridae]
MSASWVFLFGLLLVVSGEREALWLGDYSVEDLAQTWTKEARAEFCDRFMNMITEVVDIILEEATEDGWTGYGEAERRAWRRRGRVGMEDLAQDWTEDMKSSRVLITDRS